MTEDHLSHSSPPSGPLARHESGPTVPLAPAPAAIIKTSKKAAPPAPQDGVREVVETIVFVVVLVLLLKAFVAEAFVIPTGSMATTLLGYQKNAVCPECGYAFPVNCSDTVERKDHPRILGGVCPNCRYLINFRNDEDPACSTGDRVLVAKYFYDSGVFHPERLQVVVFKYPRGPQENFIQMNYIKRLIGLPGETIGIRDGKLYVLPADAPQSPHYHDDPPDPRDLWHVEYMHTDDPTALGLFQRPDSPFEIVRKPPDQILALRRIVYDNDHPAKDLEASAPPRWSSGNAASGWKADTAAHSFRHAGAGEQGDWLRYRNILRDTTRPELITDFLGYNSMKESGMPDSMLLPRNWVGDLLLEGEVSADRPEGELTLELTKGVDRFRARWQLATGECMLLRVRGDKEETLATKPTSFKGGSTQRLRFANVDDRLVVWVGNQLPFGAGVNYAAPSERGPTDKDLEPARIGLAHGASVQVRHLQLWRDTYYTVAPNGHPNRPDFETAVEPGHGFGDESEAWREARRKLETGDGWSDPEAWELLRHAPAKTMYVQPGHYLCMGDNSPASSDSRYWGLVPERLLLGRAMLVYFPFSRGGAIK